MVDAWQSASFQNRFFITANKTGELVKVGPNGNPDGANIHLEDPKVGGLTGEVVNTSNRIQMDIEGKCGQVDIIVASQTGKLWGVSTTLGQGVVLVDASKAGAQFTDVEILQRISGKDDGKDHGTTDADDSKDGGKRLRGPIVIATDFHNGVIRAWDSQFHLIDLGDRFKLPNMPKDVSPFGLMVFEDQLFVTYARRAAPEKGSQFDEQKPGFGQLAAFDATTGKLQWTVTDGLNIPYGMAMSEDFLRCARPVLVVGNHVEDTDQPGQIRAFDSKTGKFLGKLLDGEDKKGNAKPVAIDGLWGLELPTRMEDDDLQDLLHFAAGPKKGQDGLFGRLVPLERDDDGHGHDGP